MTARVVPDRAAHPQRRSRRAALTAVGVATGLVLGVGGAWAYWAATGTATAPPALTSGSLDMTVDGTLAGPGGTVALGTALTLTDARPTMGDSAAVTVGNTGSTPFQVTVTPTGQGTIGPYLVSTVAYGGTVSGSGCTGGSATPAVIQPGGTLSVCVAVTVDAAAPASAQGTTGSVALSFVATQVTS